MADLLKKSESRDTLRDTMTEGPNLHIPFTKRSVGFSSRAHNLSFRLGFCPSLV